MFIDDGKGDGRVAGVNAKNQLLTKAITEPQFANVALADAQLYVWTSTDSATADDVVIYIQNDDPSNYLRINDIMLSSAVAQLWTLSRWTEGTAAGTAITGVNHNFASGKTAQATALGDAAVTGITGSTVLKKVYTPANEDYTFHLDGSLVLPVNTAIMIAANATGAIAISVCGYYELID